jgi:TPR repeat protein
MFAAMTHSPLRAQSADDAAFAAAIASLKLGNYAVAREQFAPLARAGDAASQYNLGWLLAKGLGGPQDLVGAYQWFALVARAGHDKGREGLAEVARLMTPAQIAEGRRRAEAWRPLTTPAPD